MGVEWQRARRPTSALSVRVIPVTAFKGVHYRLLVAARVSDGRRACAVGSAHAWPVYPVAQELQGRDAEQHAVGGANQG